MAAAKGKGSVNVFQRALRSASQANRSSPAWAGNFDPSPLPPPSQWGSLNSPTAPLYNTYPTSDIRVPLSNGHQTIAPATYKKPPVLLKKPPLAYSRIPRVLTYDPEQRSSPYGTKKYRAAIISHLAPDTGLSEITAGIAQTAPVGLVTEVSFLPAGDEGQALSARVVFGSHLATEALEKAAKSGTFRVKGVAPTVVRDRTIAHHWSNVMRIDSRVVLVRGRPGTDGFSEEGIRAAIAADADALARAGGMGAECEPVVTYPVDDGCVTMEWRFFSKTQAGAMRLAIERHFRERVEVYKGYDPCWVDEKKDIVPSKLNREQAWRLW